MDLQLIFSMALVLCACLYLGKRIGMQFQKSDQNPQCGECHSDEGSMKTDKQRLSGINSKQI